MWMCVCSGRECFFCFFFVLFFFFNDTATTEIYTFPYTTLFRSEDPRNDLDKEEAAGATGEAKEEKDAEQAAGRQEAADSREETPGISGEEGA